ncbi:Blastula protease 10 [Nymphon striatum]|nr:Blastula protease 10 [Nymphon striatum]
MKTITAFLAVFCSICSVFTVPIVDVQDSFERSLSDHIILNGTADVQDFLPEEIILNGTADVQDFLPEETMPKSCCAYGCTNHNIMTGSKMSFHGFPKHPETSLSSLAIAAIDEGLSEWRSKTCLAFTDRTSDSSFDPGSSHIIFKSDESGCWSYVGNIGRPQPVNIGSNCEKAEITIHEIGHAMGFFHEQSRTGRDDYVTILTDNIEAARVDNFDSTTSNNYGVPYDYRSIMHYSPGGFSSPRYEVNTIRSINPRYQYILGSGKVLSFRDEKTANMAYCVDARVAGCAAVSSSDSCNEGYLQEDCTCKCPDGLSGDNCELGTETEIVPCGQTITTVGTYTTPNYPSRSSDIMERMCVYEIKAPSASQRIEVHFEDFDFEPRNSFNNVPVCFVDAVEVRNGGTNSEGDFKCGTELNGMKEVSVNDEMVILINVRQIFQFSNRKGMKFDVAFIDGTTTTEATTTEATTTAEITTTTEATTTQGTTTQGTTTQGTTTQGTTTEETTTQGTTTQGTTTQGTTTQGTTTQGTTTEETTTQETTTQGTTTQGTTTTEATTTKETTTTEATTTEETTTTEATTTEATTTEAATTQAPTISTLICGETNRIQTLATNEILEVVSDNYGIGSYSANQKCIVKVKTDSSCGRFKIDVMDMDLADHQACKLDYFIIKSGSRRRTYEILCGTDTVSRTIEDNYLKLIFFTDENTAGSGFKASFTALDSVNSRSQESLMTRIIKDEADVQALVTMLESNWINPFDENSQELVSISPGKLATPDITEDLLHAHESGKKAYDAFKTERLEQEPPAKNETTAHGKDLVLKADRNLFAHMLLVAQSRKLKIKDVLSHPLGPLSMALASPDGMMRTTNKSPLGHELQNDVYPAANIPQPCCCIIDGMVLVQKMRDCLRSGIYPRRRRHPHASRSDYEAIVVVPDDTDVLVLSLAFKPLIPTNMYVKCGTKTRVKYADITKVFYALEYELSQALSALQNSPDIPGPGGHGWKLDLSDPACGLVLDWVEGKPAPEIVLEFMACVPVQDYVYEK